MNRPLRPEFLSLIDSLKAVKPKRWTVHDLMTITTSQLDAMPEADQKSYGRALFDHWAGKDIEKQQAEYQADKNDERNQDFTR